MTYNKSEIMQRAWILHRNRNSFIFEQLRHTKRDAPFRAIIVSKIVPFSVSLKQAWDDAKMEVAKAKAVASLTEAGKARLAEIDRDIFYVQMIDRWSDSDYAMYDRLHNERKALLEGRIKEAA